jgi:hypothetical protein
VKGRVCVCVCVLRVEEWCCFVVTTSSMSSTRTWSEIVAGDRVLGPRVGRGALVRGLVELEEEEAGMAGLVATLPSEEAKADEVYVQLEETRKRRREEEEAEEAETASAPAADDAVVVVAGPAPVPVCPITLDTRSPLVAHLFDMEFRNGKWTFVCNLDYHQHGEPKPVGALYPDARPGKQINRSNLEGHLRSHVLIRKLPDGTIAPSLAAEYSKRVCVFCQFLPRLPSFPSCLSLASDLGVVLWSSISYPPFYTLYYLY